MKPLLPQQSLMADFMETNSEAAVFADPGLGKTRAVIEAATRLFETCSIRGVLVTAPLRVARLTWPSEIKRWSTFSFADLRTPEGLKLWDEGKCDFYLINTEYLIQFCERCLLKRKKIPADMLVLDELGMFRNASSKRAKALRSYRKLFSRFVGLTGTPVPNSTLDLFGQIRMLDGGERFGAFEGKFKNRFFTADYMGYKWTPKKGATQEIEELISDMSLVLRSQDYLDIPPVSFADVDVVFPPEVMKQYRQLEKDLIILIKDKEVIAPSAAALVQKLHQFTGGQVYSGIDAGRSSIPIHDLKVEAIRKLHKQIGGKPLLVGVQFIAEMEMIKKAIPEAQIFDESKMDDWNAGKIPMWLANPKSVKYGLNMQGSCCNLVWYSLPYSYEEYQQFNGRVARSGQKNPTTIWRLLVEDTIDWSIEEVLRNKENGQSALLRNLLELDKSRLK